MSCSLAVRYSLASFGHGTLPCRATRSPARRSRNATLFDTNSTKIIENIRSQEIRPDNNKSQSNLLSPVRIGDTFDKLVKKMQKYEDSPSYKENISTISSSSNSKPVEINTDCHDETRQSKEDENMQTNGESKNEVKTTF